MEKLFFITSIFPAYRQQLIIDLAAQYEMFVLASLPERSSGFLTPEFDHPNIHFIELTTKKYLSGKIYCMQGIIKLIKQHQPGLIMISAATRDLAFWNLLIYGKLDNLKIYAHGQGPFNKGKSYLNSLIYKIIQKLNYRYITYNHFSFEGFKRLGIPVEKVRIAENSVANEFPLPPESRNYNSHGILFIGRIREGCGLELLLYAISVLKTEFPDITCHIIGDGTEVKKLKAIFPSDAIIWHGMIYDDLEVRKISQQCSVGCYPGNAGLSVVHYLSLSLPVIIHGRLMLHQGPEPSYIIHDHNGLYYSHGDKNSLLEVLREILLVPEKRRQLGHNAYATYRSLIEPSYAQRISKILVE